MRKFLVFAGLIALLVLISGMVSAQDSTLVFEGDRRFGEVTDTQPINFFSFNGQVGDLVTARLFMLTPGSIPTIALNSPSGRQVAFIEGAGRAAHNGDVALSSVLTEAGLHTLQISTVPGTPRSGYILLFNGYAAGQFVDVSLDTVTVDIPANSAPALFSFSSGPDGSIPLSVSGGNFVAEFYTPDGQLVASLASPPADGGSVSIPGGEGAVRVLVFAGTQDGILTISRGESTGETPQPVQPVVTEEAAPPATSTCTVSGTGVNVRSGPGTDFNAVSALNGSSPVVATTADGWYQISSPAGFVFGQVVTVSGDCTGLPVVTGDSGSQTSATSVPETEAAPPATTEEAESSDSTEPTSDAQAQPTQAQPTQAQPTQAQPTQAQPTQAQPTQAQPTQVQPTQVPPTQVPPTPTATPTATATEVVAFPPSPTQYRFNLSTDTPVNGTETFSQSLPSPGWHLVTVRMQGLSNQPGNLSSREFTIIVSCASNAVRWGSGGTNGATDNQCNQATFKRFTFDNNQLFLSIKLEGGPGVTYDILATRTG